TCRMKRLRACFYFRKIDETKVQPSDRVHRLRTDIQSGPHHFEEGFHSSAAFSRLMQYFSKMKLHHAAFIFLAAMAIVSAGLDVSTAADLVTAEAESGTLGTNFLVSNSSGIISITCTNNN